MRAKTEFVVNTAVASSWFDCDSEWQDFLVENYSKGRLDQQCHKCTRAFLGLFGKSRAQADQFLAYFFRTCHRCQEMIFNNTKPKTKRWPGLGGEFTARLIQRKYNGIIDRKSENKRVIHKVETKNKTTSKTSQTTLRMKSHSYPADKKLKIPLKIDTLNKSKQIKQQKITEKMKPRQIRSQTVPDSPENLRAASPDLPRDKTLSFIAKRYKQTH